MTCVENFLTYGEDNDGWYVEKDGVQIAYGLSEETARRISACVNACSGSSTDWLEFSISEDCAELVGPHEPLETRITSILRGGLGYMLERDKLAKRVEGLESVMPAAHRLALELECLLLDTNDTALVSKWWDSANEALEQWREITATARESK